MKVYGFCPQICVTNWYDLALEKGFDNFIIEWMVGSYSRPWMWWKKRGQVVTDTLPKTAIIHHSIKFTATNRLSADLVANLKSLYSCALCCGRIIEVISVCICFINNHCYHGYWTIAISRQYHSIIMEKSWSFHDTTHHEFFMKFHGNIMAISWQPSTMKMPLNDQYFHGLPFHGIFMTRSFHSIFIGLHSWHNNGIFMTFHGNMTPWNVNES